MQLFIIRHAHALDGADDAARPPSKRGHQQIRTVAKFLKRSGMLNVPEFWHSPLVRARESAVEFVDRLGSKSRLVETESLAPGHDPAEIAVQLNKRRQSVAIVGHEPHLGALASLLVTGRASPAAFELKKCAVLALEREGRRWVVLWHIMPELVA